MKKISVLLVLALSVWALNAQQACDPAKEKANKKNSGKSATGSFGAAITKDGAVDVKTLPESLKGKPSANVKIKGDVVAACQVKGCWMTADLGNGESMRIRFKDYAFFVPKDAGGKEFYAQGVASWDTTSVAELQHYAEDAGKSKEEIEKIKTPKVELVFLAEGVIIEEKKKQ